MASPLVTYLQDHLAGATFAVSLLHDLSGQTIDAPTAQLAAELLPQIEKDRAVLEGLVADMGEDSSTLKEALAWFSQKAGRMKLSMSEPEGVFEAVELLALGVLGKLALWNALETLASSNSSVSKLDLDSLCDRAKAQHAALEDRRRRLATKAFATS
jgi:hypothetical protein